MEITTSLTSEFVSLLRHDLVERIDANQETWSDGRRQEFDTALRDRMRPLLQALMRTKGILEATLAWREVVMAEVRAAVKRVRALRPGACVVNNVENRNSEYRCLTWATMLQHPQRTYLIPYRWTQLHLPTRSEGVASLRVMDHTAFLELARGMYRSLLNCIEGVHRQGAIIVEVVQRIQCVTILSLTALPRSCALVPRQVAPRACRCDRAPGGANGHALVGG